MLWVSSRHIPHGEHRVSEKLNNRSVMLGDVLAKDIEIFGKHRRYVFRRILLAYCCEIVDVGEKRLVTSSCFANRPAVRPALMIRSTSSFGT